MRQFLLYSFSFFIASLFIQKLSAQTQPPICPTDELVEMSPFCEDACIICDIDGFSGRNGRDDEYFLPDDFCTLRQHNGKWIGFIAGSVDLSVRLSVSNCELNTGLEIGIYEATDCSNPVSVGSCFGGMSSIPPGSSAVFENLVPLVVGQYYYIVMDGGRDDVCDWEFTVIEGTTAVAPLTTSGPIIGPTSVCPNVPIAYSTEVELGAAAFSWTVDGIVVATGQSPEITWDLEGNFELCVTASNACDQAIPFCTTVSVQSIPTVVIDTTICSDQSIVFGDSTLTQAGQYNFNFTTAIGCDSNFIINVTEVMASEQLISLNICSDDVFELNGQAYDQTGTYQQILTNQFGCDSTLNIELTFIECTIAAEQTVFDVNCNGANDGAVQFSITNGTPVFTYQLTDLAGAIIADGLITMLNEVIVLNDISPGQYQIIIQDQFGNDARILNLLIEEPDPLSSTISVSDFNGFSVSCFESQDGQITLVPSGGTPLYQVAWNDGRTGLTISDLSAGTYNYTITDANSCTQNGFVEVDEPIEITAQLLGNDASCAGPNTGSIQVLSPAGGAGGFSYRLNNGQIATEALFVNLAEGSYVVEVLDANGCSSVFMDTLGAALIPVLEIPAEFAIIELGTSGRVTFNTRFVNELVWTAEVANSIIDSGTSFISLAPTTSGVMLGTAISVDGCTTTDSIRIVVENPRKVYAPNAFSPNSDGLNDNFQLFGGEGVAEIESFQVFNRWGGLVYEQLTGEPVWDGLSAAGGTYVWRAIIVYLNGDRQLLTGSVVLLR